MFLILFLLNTQDNITAAFDRSKYSLGIFIEITKAIDTVNHENLENLSIGLSGVALNWF